LLVILDGVQADNQWSCRPRSSLSNICRQEVHTVHRSGWQVTRLPYPSVQSWRRNGSTAPRASLSGSGTSYPTVQRHFVPDPSSVCLSSFYAQDILDPISDVNIRSRPDLEARANFPITRGVAPAPRFRVHHQCHSWCRTTNSCGVCGSER